MIIQLKSITKSYDQQFKAVDEVSLTVATGDIFGIVGQSGAGKSTLLRCVNLLERPEQGEVWVNGDNLMQLSAQQLRHKRQQISMIFQHFNLLRSASVFDNVALPLMLQGKSKHHIKQRVESLLALVELSGKAACYPEQLSGGQKQRVAIARALATEPSLLLCDEATSALDPVATQSVLALLRDINQRLGITIVLITHEMDVIKAICDKVAILEHGKLIEQGGVLDVFAQPAQAITKQLTQQVLFQPLPAVLAQQLQSEPTATSKPLVRLIFMGDAADKPILSSIHQKFSVCANIVQANIESIHGVTVGYTVCELAGTKQQIEQAMLHIQQQQVQAEVLGYVG